MKRRKPIIGIPANLMVDNNGSFPGSRRVIVNQDYLLSVQAAGGQPIILPYTAGVEDIPAQLALVDGMLFTGGADMDPLVYEEQPIPGLEDVYREVDDHQVALCLAGWRQGLPMFGICRGMQVLNVALGGTLHQDLQSLPIPILGHVQKGLRYAVSHLVDTEEGSRLRALFTQATIGTNSFHHQAIKDLAPGFRVSARARDGVIEGIECTDDRPVYGVQWHPEGMVDKTPEMLNLFRELVNACDRRKAGRSAVPSGDK